MTDELDPQLCQKAIAEALARFPEFAEFGPKLVGRPLFQGMAYHLVWDREPPKEMSGAWECQNTAVKAYRRLAGV